MRETLRIHLYRHHSLEQSIEIQSCIDLGPVLRDELLLCMETEETGCGQLQPCAAVALGWELLKRSSNISGLTNDIL